MATTIKKWSVSTLSVEYTVSLFATLFGFAGLSHALVEPYVFWLFAPLACLGYLISGLLRAYDAVGPRLKRYGVIADVILSVFGVLANTALTSNVLPVQVIAGDFLPAIGMAWLLAFRSFVLYTDGALLFQLLPPIAIFGLGTTWVMSSEMLALFFCYLVCAVYVMASQHRRSMDEGLASPPANRETFDVTIPVWACGFVVATVLLSAALAPVAQGTMQIVSSTLGLPIPPRGGFNSSRAINPNNDVQVGTGPVDITGAEIMRVRSPRPFYLRGKIYQEYTGRGWNNDSLRSSSRYMIEPKATVNTSEWLIPRAETPRDPNSPDVSIVNVTFMNSANEVTLYAPEGTFLVRGATLDNLYIDDDECLTTENAPNELQYQLKVMTREESPDALRQIPDSLYVSPELLQCWPANATAAQAAAANRIDQKARELTASIPNRYDKVVALQNYIASRCVYNTQAQAFPKDSDVVDYFLNVQQEGYCDAFATSLAILCRHAGIPARVASGFLPGDLDPEKGEYVVKDSHRHLWTEVYFEGAGWVIFDATQNVREAAFGERGETPNTLLGRLGFVQGSFWHMLALGIVLAGMGYLAFLLYRRLRGRFQFAMTSRMSAINSCFESVCRTLASQGYPVRERYLTPHEYESLVTPALPETLRSGFAELIDQFTRLFYSPAAVSGEQLNSLKTQAKNFERDLKANGKLKI